MSFPLDSTQPVRLQTAAPSNTALRQQLEKALSQLPGGGSEQAGGPPAQTLDRETLQAQSRHINGVLRSYGVEFEISGDPPQTITRIVDSETRDVIRQIPSEEVLAFVARLDELRGLLLQQGA